MTTIATPTRVFDEVDCFVDVAFQCGYFDVVYDDPTPGVNLIVARKVESYQERNFEDRLLGEIRYAGKNCCHIYSTRPLNFTHIRHGILTYQGVARGEDFGPFYEYTYIKLYQ